MPPHGWLVIDKPAGITSNRVVETVRRAVGIKAGHAGTLDPLATGVLPVALGEATKTVGYAMAGRKTYRFRIRWGIARTTEDAEGEITDESPARPDQAAIEAALPRFIGTIMQRPPAYSAIKLGGKRAYALARARPEAATPLSERPIEIEAIRLIAIPDPNHAEFEAEVGKGTYIRALARDLALELGTLGHIAMLRRLSLGRFGEAQAISLDSAVAHGHSLATVGFLLPVETALDDIPALALTVAEAARLRHGQRVLPGEPDARARFDQLHAGTIVSARCARGVVALARIEKSGLQPMRILHP